MLLSPGVPGDNNGNNASDYCNENTPVSGNCKEISRGCWDGYGQLSKGFVWPWWTFILPPPNIEICTHTQTHTLSLSLSLSLFLSLSLAQMTALANQSTCAPWLPGIIFSLRCTCSPCGIWSSTSLRLQTTEA